MNKVTCKQKCLEQENAGNFLFWRWHFKVLNTLQRFQLERIHLSFFLMLLLWPWPQDLSGIKLEISVLFIQNIPPTVIHYIQYKYKLFFVEKGVLNGRKIVSIPYKVTFIIFTKDIHFMKCLFLRKRCNDYEENC